MLRLCGFLTTEWVCPVDIQYIHCMSLNLREVEPKVCGEECAVQQPLAVHFRLLDPGKGYYD